MEKLIITVATTGAVTTRANTPYIPLTPQEIADEVYACWQEGAAIAHIHVRDSEGRPSMDYNTFEQTKKLIRERCDIILNFTSSGGSGYSDETRIKPLALKPEMMSFDAGTTNFGQGVFTNTPQFLEKLAAAMLENGVKPEVEVFEIGWINNALTIAKKGLIQTPIHFQFVLGVPGAMPATPKNLLNLVESIPVGSTWSAFGIGRAFKPIANMAIHMGGHVRVGMEDNVFLKKGVLAQSNAEFVKMIVRMSEDFERPLATPDEARRILGILK